MALTMRRCLSVAQYGTPYGIGSVRRACGRVQQPTGLVELALAPGKPFLTRLRRGTVDELDVDGHRPVPACARVLLHDALAPARPHLHPENHARGVPAHRLAEQALRDLGRGLGVAARQFLAQVL